MSTPAPPPPPPQHVNEHLANERTYLAWIRTSITVIGLGFVVARFSLWLRYTAAAAATPPAPHTRGLATPLGALMVVAGILLTLVGSYRYARVKNAIDHGGPVGASASIFVISTLITLFAIAILIIVVRT